MGKLFEPADARGFATDLSGRAGERQVEGAPRRLTQVAASEFGAGTVGAIQESEVA